MRVIDQRFVSVDDRIGSDAEAEGAFTVRLEGARLTTKRLSPISHWEMEADMPSIANENSERMSLRVPATAKAKLLRAAALRNTDLTNFVTQSALREAEAVIEEAETIKVSKRDHLRILELLENPPKPNAKLRAAIAGLPDSL